MEVLINVASINARIVVKQTVPRATKLQMDDRNYYRAIVNEAIAFISH